MSFDPRSRERLEALGRQLPQPLPNPEPRRSPQASEPRHAVEREENPEQLFRELMRASKDGSVPPHLLDRLRQLEQARLPRRSPAMPAAAARGPAATPSPDPDRDLYEAFEDLLRLSEDDDGEPSPRSSRPGAASRPAAARAAQPPRREPFR